MTKPIRKYHDDYSDRSADEQNWGSGSYSGEMGLNDDDDGGNYNSYYASPTGNASPSTSPTSAGRRKQSTKKNFKSNSDKDARRGSTSSPASLSLTPLGSMKKLLKSPGTMRRMLGSSNKRQNRRTSSTGGSRSLRETRPEDLLSNPKLYDELNDDDKGKLDRLLTREFGLDPL